jgi:hypothetical protein
MNPRVWTVAAMVAAIAFGQEITDHLSSPARGARTPACSVPTHGDASCSSLLHLQHADGDRLPAALVSQIKGDLGVSDVDECLTQAHLTFGQRIRVSRLSLDSGGHPAILIQGLGTCVGAGANNGPFLLYAKFGQRWDKIFDETGQRVRQMKTTARGWKDLEVWAHNSAYESTRMVYRFDGTRYSPLSCRVVRYTIDEWDKPNRKPIYEPCDRILR